MALTEAAARAALESLLPPHASAAVRIDGGTVHATLTLAHPAQSRHAALQAAASDALRAAGAAAAEVTVRSKVIAHQAQRGLPLLPGVANIVAVASGKGGVGKSTVTANLALALAAEGARVGVMDADIYGPSMPMMLGVAGRPESLDGKTMEPLAAHGLKVASIGFLVKPDDAVVWRGPMATQALDQLLKQTNWGELDYLLVDLPPGTGDIQITLAQRVPLTGAVIVTTPQDVALADARKGLAMFGKVNVPVLGVVENMAFYCCPNCGHEDALFGTGGGERLAEAAHVPLLGRLPLVRAVREQADAGTPIVAAAPDSPAAASYRALAEQVALAVAGLPKDYSSKFPPIQVSS
ncbi:MAG: iron-sulfur cluster carrier protein ApbC [Proteobacteria bacterium]|nr:iron-sulfur cluster carrier protein ApbC [Pseudomonadota bacterium]